MEESAFQIQKDEGESDANISLLGDKELGYSKDDSLTSIDIQEMERVRLSLQSMLKSSEHFLRDDDKTALETLHRTGESRRKGDTDAELFNASIGTSVLLNNFLNADKQEVAMVSDSTSFDENSETMRRSRTKYDKSLVLENSILNESLEKERFKRRHCEAQIKDLQSKLLETQQHLALSASGERKKDVMINQLDKTLARVVEDWKKHEQGKLDALGKLEERREEDEQSQQRYQEMLTQFEKDLSQAVEALSTEEERAANAEREKDSQIATVMEERNQLLQLLAREREKTAALEKQIQALEAKTNRSEDLGRLLDKEKHAWNEERSELESKIELITQAHVQDLENEKKLVDNEKQVAEDSQRVLAAVQKEVQQLTIQLDTSNREKENLKTDMTLLAAKYEAQTTRQESEHRAELERQLSKSLREVQNQLTRNENEMRTAHKKQIEDLTKKYKNDLEDQLRNFHQQLKERDKKLKETNEDYEEKLSKTHEQLVKTSSEREAVKNEKHKMVVRLQKMMQSHCEEALSLLVANTVNLGVENALNDQHRNAPWITRQTPTLVTRAVDVGISRESSHDMPHHIYHGDGRKSSGNTGNTSQRQTRYSNQSWEHTQPIAQSADDLVHTWRRLSPMVAEPQQTEKLIPNFHETSGHPERSYPQNDEIQETMGGKSLSDHSSPGEERNVEHTHQSTVKDLQYQSDDEKGLHATLSPSTTNESLDEQTMEEDYLESGKPNLPLNISSDVLKMLHQQQSRQTELNHYVRQLLKKSPSSGGGGEIADSGQLSRTSLSVVHSDTSEPVISPIKEDNFKKDNTVRSSASKISPTAGHLPSASSSTMSKQMAFKKSAATPRKGFNSSRISVPQTYPNKDFPSEKDDTTGNSTLTPKQVGQLARLIQMYQKDNEDVNLPSPQKMFQYLRDVQTRGEIEQREWHVNERELERKTSLSESVDPALFLSKHVKKDSRTKRKLEVNIPTNNSKEVIVTGDPPLSEMGRNGPARETSTSQDGVRRPARAPLTSESVLSSSRKPETRSKSKNTVAKQPKRASGKSTKAWK